MRKGKDVIGKDVLSFGDGQKLRAVKDVVLDPENAEIVALFVDEGGLLSGSALIVPLDRVTSFGKDAVVIQDSNSVVPASSFRRMEAVLKSNQKLLGKKVFTDTGSDQGTVSDIYFEEETGRVMALEVTRGVLKDAARGTLYVPVDEIVRAGPDVIYINEATAGMLDAQAGGVQGALQGGVDKLKGATDQAGAKVAESKPEERIIGQRAGTQVEDEDGSIIVAVGQRITAEHVERARERDRIQQLTAAAAAGTAKDLKDRGADTAGAAGDTLGNVWDRFTRKLSEMTDATGKRVDEAQTRQRLSQIEDAIGRPVTKVILDREDNVILNLGDIITHQSIQRAYESGQLDSLLKSAYVGQVAFEKDEMRARQEGAAVIERATGEAPIVDELEQRVIAVEVERQEQSEQRKAEAEEARQQREREREERAGEREQRKAEREADKQEGEAVKAEARSG